MQEIEGKWINNKTKLTHHYNNWGCTIAKSTNPYKTQCLVKKYKSKAHSKILK